MKRTALPGGDIVNVGGFGSRLWQTEWGLSAMLVFLVLSLFVGAPLRAMGVVGPFLFNLLFSLLLLSGAVTVAGRRWRAGAVFAVVAAALCVRWAGHASAESAIFYWDNALTILSLSTLTALLLTQVFREGPVTGRRIQGAIAAYLLFGLVWASTYELIYAAVPGSFQFASSVPGSSRVGHGLVYYSLVTLTTVGYGDITPIHPLARSLATAEALIGQLYPAIFIARLVSLEVESRQRS